MSPDHDKAYPWSDDDTLSFGRAETPHDGLDDHTPSFVAALDDDTATADLIAAQLQSLAAGGGFDAHKAQPEPTAHATADTFAAGWESGFDAPPWASGDMTMDAKSGGTSKPGGGASGGSGGGTLLTTYTSGDANVADSNEFNIKIDFSGTWTTQQQAIVTWAADQLSRIIVGDARDDTDLSGNAVDDVVITVSTGRIDGSGNPLLGNTLAQTSISAVRDPGSVQEWLPVTSSIKLDATDLKNSVTGGWSDAWDDIVLHEMINAIGFSGVVFDGLGLVDAQGMFTGAQAVAAYGGLVAIEAGGTTATAGSHWAEAGFAPGGTSMANEIMTGWMAGNEQTFLSDTTIAALADLGYQVQDPSSGDYLAIGSGLLLA